MILPLFALANTAIVINDGWVENLTQPYSVGIALGLILGKPIGITLLTFIAVSLGICQLPGDFNWKHVIGAGFLDGIGFTMSIFIALLAFENAEIINNSKFMKLLASLVAGLVGFLWLKYSLAKKQ